MKTKITIKTIMLLAFNLFAMHLFAQPQMSNWYISPQKINVSGGTGTAVITAMSGATASAEQVANSIYDNSGNLLFYIADNNIYNSSNTSIGGLANYSRTMEVTVIPFNCEGGKYHLFYMASGVPYDTYLYYATVDITTNTVTASSTPLLTFSGGDVGGLAAGNLTTSGKRFVFAIWGYGFAGTGKIERITINPDNSLSTTTIVTGNSTPGFGSGIDFATAEADLSHDGTKLAWAGMGNTANKAYIISLDANGNYVSSSLVQYAYGATGYIGRGVEFNADGTKLYAGGSNGIYQVTGTGSSLTTAITGTSSYGKSQLEMGINGFIYAVHSLQTYIIGINPASNSLSTAVAINNPPYENVSGFLTLPDQIDGFNYTTQTNAFHAVNPTGTTTTWTPTINPFGNVNPVRIKTSLTIPNGVNLRIDNMTIEFGLGATLIIQNGGTLRLYNTTLQSACPYSMWQGVTVSGTGSILMDDISNAGSEIYDAIKGIDANGASAQVQVIDNSEFNRNEKHIVITNGNSSNIIRKSFFNHTTQLKDQARGVDQSNGSGTPRYGEKSIELINTTNTQTIGHSSSGQGNTFTDGQYGIYAVNSNFNSYRNAFNTIRTRGIFADGQYQNRTANITTFNSFTSNRTAIDAHYGVNLTVQSNTFTTGSEHGILWFYNNGCDLKVGHRSNTSLGNTFSYQNWSAIFANDNAHANTQITIGSNTIQTSSYIHGILVQETSLATNNTYQEMFINKNNISNIDYGIKVANVKGYDNQQNPSYTVEYVSNTLEIDSNTVNQFGIAKKGIWGENSPRIRTLENDVFTTDNFTWGNVGIEFSNGYKGAIARNYCIAGAGIVSISNMLDANIACNILESNIVGIDLNYEQLRLTSAQTHGTVGADNRYNSFLTIPTWGWDMRLYYSSQNQNKWVDPNTTNAKIDYSSATLPYPPNSIIVTGGSYSPCYASFTGGGEQNGFSENEEFEYLEQIEDVNNRWLTEYMLQSENYEAEENFSQTENTFIPQLITFENFFSSGNFDAASEILQQLNPEHQFEVNFKEVYEVALGYRTEEIRKLYGKEIERLVAVASQNPRDGGPAVYSARAILKFKENMDFTDKYEAPPYNISSESNKTDETNSVGNSLGRLKVYPNPADNELTVETPEKGLYLVTISNAFGQKVSSGSFNNTVNKINTNELRSGIYLVEIINEETNSSYFEKITIK
jgi:hypothetical protein